MPPDHSPGVVPAIHENTVLSGIRYWLNTIFLNIAGYLRRQPVDGRHKAGHDGKGRKFRNSS
jgi:hypothetical protein